MRPTNYSLHGDLWRPGKEPEIKKWQNNGMEDKGLSGISAQSGLYMTSSLAKAEALSKPTACPSLFFFFVCVLTCICCDSTSKKTTSSAHRYTH